MYALQSSYDDYDSSESSEEIYELRPYQRKDLWDDIGRAQMGDDFDEIDDPEYGPYFEGDMLNNPYERNGIPGAKFRWKKGIVHYDIDLQFSYDETMHIYKAVETIQNNTCIIFEEIVSNNYSVDYIFFNKVAKGCSSNVGRQGGRQPVNLASACFSKRHGKPMHEVLHALGFYHEHCRGDRDQYVSINTNNIKKGHKHNFDIKPSKTFQVSYDYHSIMHYSAYAFAINPNIKTIDVLQSNTNIGQRKKMSKKDIKKVEKMYKAECDSRYVFQAFNLLRETQSIKNNNFSSLIGYIYLKLMYFQAIILLLSLIYATNCRPDLGDFYSRDAYEVSPEIEIGNSRENPIIPPPPDSREDLYTSLDDQNLDLENPELGPFLEGDILGDPYKQIRNGIVGPDYRWRKGIVEYFIPVEDFTYDEHKVIIEAMSEIEIRTCIKLILIHKDMTGDYIHFMKHSKHCFSHVGRQVGRQDIYMAPNCLKTTGTTLHETLHAIGFYHEHIREDRDPYVRIHKNRIEEWAWPNFEKVQSVYYGFSYDYGSIMHYSQSAFAKKKGDITIEVLQSDAPPIGQRITLSDTDVGKIQKMYKRECDSREADKYYRSAWANFAMQRRNRYLK
ncbi:unnamed protein product [Allacma fusca]|uniref:Peptidase M12A domain-containing protein n=1 Tax=Allacma fusca TaxID=39272 RepID=A0A8J2LXL4_9HEXA|nr:unnamed protein product [Allacma fusca]